MMFRRKYLVYPVLVVGLFLMLLSSCSFGLTASHQTAVFETSVAQTADLRVMQTALFNTRVVLTSAVRLTEMAQQNTMIVEENPSNIAVTQSAPMVSDTVVALGETAPSELPVNNTNQILSDGECFDFDSGSVGTSGNCDIFLDPDGVFSTQNGSKISLYTFTEVPTKNHCQGEDFREGRFGPNVNQYMCFLTADNRYGFFLLKDDQWLSQKRVVFDWWLFSR